MKRYSDHTTEEWAALTSAEQMAIIEADMDRGCDEAQARGKAELAEILADDEKSAAHADLHRRAELGYQDAIATIHDPEAGSEDECCG